MTQGVTGSFSFDGTELLQSPETFQWVSKELVGISGNAHPVYPAVRQFEMKWGFMEMDAFAQLQGFYDGIQSTGTVVVDLPKYASSPYSFQSYSGCTLKEPTAGNFFEYWVSDVTLTVLRIQV
jgi:hypothetical protein